MIYYKYHFVSFICLFVAFLSSLANTASGQNRLAQSNNIDEDYLGRYASVIDNVETLLMECSDKSIQQLVALSENRLDAKYLLSQARTFKAAFRQLENSTQPALHSKREGRDKWYEYTYFSTDAKNSVDYFLQLKVVFVVAYPTALSKLKIGDEVPMPKIKFLQVLRKGELKKPDYKSFLIALKEADLFAQKISSPAFQKWQDSLIKAIQKSR